ncbi:hypothetical protein A2V71_04040 [Candidatus Berkelbacteria bacterium RBG_13_40_8]|uniref:Uncharacterized protein n=1 Tax=Candidatus Berkelbacteria bacterium RBG_13_40_8 TaxID=1797467 RepID=A0A1F5DM78_9BACT|nr:MAG: hypothetical protein A2V71_04040 [Candidatus Berkelbacteria bacterium RBG_13_40_8]
MSDRLHLVIPGLFSEMPDDGVKITNPGFMIEVQKLQKKHPELLRGLAFSNNTSIPWSKRLEEILSIMAMSGLLYRTPLNVWYTRKVKQAYLEGYKDQFTSEEQEEISKMSKELARSLRRGELTA